MKSSLALALALTLAAAGPAGAVHQRYEIDLDRSSIRFTVPYVFMVLGEVEGEFGVFSGWVDYDPGDLSSTRVEVEIDAGSLDTRFEPRDFSLRGDDFFAVEAHPRIHFSSRQVIDDGGGPALVGTVTLRGVDGPARIPFDLLEFGDSLVVLGSTEIDREAFGMTVPTTTEDFRIGETVTVRMHLTLTRRQADPPPR